MTPGSASPLLLDAAAGGYQISRSVRLRSSASAYFNRTPTSASNRTTWTFSIWAKRGELNREQHLLDAGTLTGFQLYWNASNQLQFSESASVYGPLTAVQRDPSAWYHIMFVWNTSQATAANRVRIYINGLEQTAGLTYPAQNTNSSINAVLAHYIGRYQSSGAYYYDGYCTEVNFIDGQALTPSSFGQTDATTGVWGPKQYTGTYGTNGFYLNFSDNSAATAAAIGKDSSGNGNNWTPNNISVTSGVTYDSMIDTPTPYADGGNGRGNYPIANPLWKATTIYIDDGNLRLQPTGSGVGAGWRSNFPMPSSTGKWYYEVTVQTVGAGSQLNHIAIGDQFYAFDLSSGSFYYYRSDGNISGTAGYASFANGSIIGVALDTAAATLAFYHNGTLQRTITSVGISTDWWPGGLIPAGAGAVSHVNFGQRPFAYTPPSGFKALNTQNLPTPSIPAGNKYFDASLYTGTGAALAVVNSGTMQPDFLWLKNRSLGTGGNHVVFDSVRGGPSNELYPNTTAVEAATTGALTSLNANGFTLGNAGDLVRYNSNGNSYVGWQWKKGATPGFDIVTYTGTGANRTVSHALGVAPAMKIVKRRDNIGAWFVYHQSLGATKYMTIDTAAATTSSTAWNNTAPTSTVFTVGTDNNVNGSGGTYVSYLFSEVSGFSKFGSYTGNGSSDGPFVYCGFKPRWVMVKPTGVAENWFMMDTARDVIDDLNDAVMFADLSNAEGLSGNRIQFVSNGFKIRTSGANQPNQGTLYIFAAFAENPFKYALAR